MILILLVGAAAGFGALARYVLDQVVQHRHDSVFPYGTLTVNTAGSLLLGLLTGLGTQHGLSSGPLVVLSAGFCSGFTTWSTYAWESIALAEAGALLEAAANAVGSLAVGLVATAAGFGLALL